MAGIRIRRTVTTVTIIPLGEYGEGVSAADAIRISKETDLVDKLETVSMAIQERVYDLTKGEDMPEPIEGGPSITCFSEDVVDVV
jgi:hypothetical protein